MVNNVPVKSKLQHPPSPWAYPGHLTVHRAWGGGGIRTLPWQGGEFEADLSLVLDSEFFRFLQGLMNLQDRISHLLVNNSLKRVFERKF